MKLKLTTALSTGTIVLAMMAPIAAQADSEGDKGTTIEIKQLSTEDISASLDVAISGVTGEGEEGEGDAKALSELTATAAAIGNTLTLDGVTAGTAEGGFKPRDFKFEEEDKFRGKEALDAISIDQNVEGDMTAKLEADIENVDVKVQGDNTFALSATGIGNAATLTDVTADALNLDQAKEDNVTAKLELDMEDVDALKGTDLSVTTAGIGNTASLTNVKLNGDVESIGFDQSVDEGDIRVDAEIDMEDVDINGAFDTTVVGIGNSLALDTVSVPDADLSIDQKVEDGDITAELNADVEDLEVGKDASITTAAIGNTATLTDVTSNQDLDLSQELDDVEVTAEADLSLDDVEIDGDLNLSVAALGNSFSLTEDTGSANFDDFTSNQVANDDIEAQMDLNLDGTDVGGSLSVSTAAIANSLSLDDVSLDNEFDATQEMRGEIYADAFGDQRVRIDDLDVNGAISVTTAGIGNSMSIANSNFDDDMQITQKATDDIDAKMDLTIEDTNISGKGIDDGTTALSVTTAAIANSLSIDNLDLSDEDFNLTQTMSDDVTAELDANIEDVTVSDKDGDLAMSLSVAALGNSATFSGDYDPAKDNEYSFEFDDFDAQQTMNDDVTAKLDLSVDDVNVIKSGTIATAALGNSLSMQGLDVDDDLNIDQTATDEITATADVEIDDLKVKGDLSVTTAAIANSLSMTDLHEVEEDFDVNQRATDDVTASMDLNLEDTNIDGKGVDADTTSLSATVAAIGNSFSADTFDLDEDAMNLDQTMSDDVFASLDAEFEDVRVEAKGDNPGLSLSTAAIGNSASIASVDFDSEDLNVSQDMFDNARATGDVDLEDTKIEGAASMTVAALGNSFSVADSKSIDDIDLEQAMTGESVSSKLDVSVDELRVGDLSLTAAAIGNSASVSNTGGYAFDAEQTLGTEDDGTTVMADLTFLPENTGEGEGDKVDFEDLPTGASIDASSVAIGNTFSAEITDGEFAQLDQTVFGVDSEGFGHDRGHDEEMFAQISATSNVNTGTIADVSVTTAAIGNSFALDGFGGGVGQSASIVQTAYASVSANAKVVSYNPEKFASTAAAIGNTGSITITMVD